MGLRFNPKTQEYFLMTKDDAAAKAAGLTLSTKIRGPNGESVYFTTEAYAALPFYRQADEYVTKHLASMMSDYEKSWAIMSNNNYEVGQADTPQRQNGLRSYQNAGVDYALAHTNCLIGDEMGIGKTATSIAVANTVGAKKVLVICPASIRLNWRKQIKLWSNIRHVRVYPILRGRDGVANYPNYTIISYELTRNPGIHAALRAIHWDVIIIDEAHFLKSHDAQRTQAIFGGPFSQKDAPEKIELRMSLAACADRIICLTGTPLPNRPRECYTLAKALCWDAVDNMSFDEFCYRFNPLERISERKSLLDGDGVKTYVREEKGRLPELHARLRCNFMVRRLKKDVLKQLPEKQYEFAYIEPDGAIREAMKRESMLHFDIDDLVNPNAEIFGEISTVRRQMGEAKVPRALEHIRYLLDIEEVDKLVLFSHHRSVMDALKNDLAEYGVVEVRGGMGTTAKENSVVQFQTNSRVRIFSGQLDAAGFGIDGLQNVASRMVFVEPAWVPGANDQAVDRLHRLGQAFPVWAQFLIVEGSLDEKVLAAVLDKAYTINEVLDKRGPIPQ